MTAAIAIGCALLLVLFAVGLALAMAKEAGRNDARMKGLSDDIEQSIKAKRARDRERHNALRDPGGLRTDDGFRRD